MTTTSSPRMRWSRFGLAAFVALVVAGSAAARVLAPNKLYRDPSYKFSIKYFSEWEQVPVEAGQEIKVAVFSDPAEKGRMVTTEIEVYRLTKSQAPTTGTGATPKTKEEMEAMYKAEFGPKSAFEAMTRTLIVPDGQKLPDQDKDAKPVVSADKVPGKMYVFEINLAGDQRPGYGTAKDYTYFAVMATFEKDGVEYGIKAMGPVRDRKKLENDYKSVMKSFKFFDAEAGDVKSLKQLDGVNISAKRRAEIERGMIKGWDVIVSPKKNYIVVYNTARGKNKLLAKTIAERIEQIREKVYEIQFPPAQKIESVSVVRVCKNSQEYHAYGGPGGSAGYWNSGTEELVFYDMSKSKKVDENTLAVLYHEAFHQYIFYSVGNVAPHSWFNEGHGDYYAGAQYSGGKFKITPFKWRIGTVKSALREGPRPRKVEKDAQGKETATWENKGYTPLEHLVRFRQFEYYSYPGVSYAQGWSFVYFLREIVPKNKAQNAKWGHILDVYFDTLKAEVNKSSEFKRPGGSAGPEDPSKPDDGEPGEPGKDGEPGEDGEPGGDDPDGGDTDTDDEPEEIDPGFQPEPGGFASDDALKKAVDAAFKGVDFAELEKAWKEAILKVSG